ncbi:early nodulin-like protein 2 [Trifolium pratense]|uniref:early nodulin-like protein 2 n=1 Tax=Trifolium pratense TaxID=57577 RepID=UPI001E690EAD|nr:early nodulin-like protein 2 [Trifolium pratense]
MEYIPLLFVLFTALLVSTSQAFKLDVGGSDGWTLNPSENYNHWAGRYRFQINDVIVFKYKKGSDSVLEVKKEDYEKCNKTNPIKKFEDGETEFTFDKSGPFYFISGKDQNCEKGQKLTLVVISPRKHTSPSVSTPTSPPKSSPSPSVSTSPPAPVPAGGPKPSSPSPVTTPPAGGPTTSSPSPVSTPPASGPTASSPSSVTTPPASGPTVSSPSPVSTPPAGGPMTSSPVSTPPAGGPTASSPTSSPTAGGPTSQSPGSSTSADGPVAPGTSTLGPSGTENAKAPSGSGSYVGPSSFVVYSVTVVVGALFLSY